MQSNIIIVTDIDIAKLPQLLLILKLIIIIGKFRKPIIGIDIEFKFSLSHSPILYLNVGTFYMLMYQTDVGTVEDESILNPPATSPSEKISSFLPANKRKLNRYFYRINYIMAYPKKLIRITSHYGPAVSRFLVTNGSTNGAGCLRGLLRLIKTHFENISGTAF